MAPRAVLPKYVLSMTCGPFRILMSVPCLAVSQWQDAPLPPSNPEPSPTSLGPPKAAKGVSAHLQPAGESLSSRACFYFGPRGPRTERQRRALKQTEKRVEDAQARKLETQAPITKDPAAQSCTQPALTPIEQILDPRFRSDFRHLPLRFLEGKDHKMSAVDRAAVRVLKGEIGLEKVGRHRVTKGAVKPRLTIGSRMVCKKRVGSLLCLWKSSNS